MLTPYKNAVVQDNLKDTDPITSGAARENNPNLASMKQYYKGEGGWPNTFHTKSEKYQMHSS